MADSFLLKALTFIIALLVIPQTSLTRIDFLKIGSLSLLSTLASYLSNEALVHGRAGPASALTEVQSLFMLLLEIAVLG